MISLLRFSWRLFAIFLWILLGLFIIGLGYTWLSTRTKQCITSWWSRYLLVLAGVRFSYSNSIRLHPGVLVVANHISWLDIFAINQAHAVCFIAKKEIRNWPLIGWLVSGVGTIFIDRNDKRDVRRVAELMQTRMSRQESVGLFPEGTTSDGEQLLPFKASLLGPAFNLNLPIQSVAIRYYKDGMPSTYPCYVGDESLLGNLWRLLRKKRIEVRLDISPVIYPAEVATNRRALTLYLEESLRLRLYH